MDIITDMDMEDIMATNRFLRNKDLIPQSKLDHIGLVGLGGIGSQLVPLLSIMGWKKMTGWDHDVLEEHNLSTTMFPQGALGKSKAEVAENIANLYSVNTVNNKFFKEGNGIHGGKYGFSTFIKLYGSKKMKKLSLGKIS